MKLTASGTTDIGRLLLLAIVRYAQTPCSAQAMRRARPGQGSDGLPFALLRVPCDARVPGPWPNSLRSLRSLRSNKPPQVRARSARVRARPGTLCFSAAPIRPAQAPPGALRARLVLLGAGQHTLLAGPRAVRRWGDRAPPRSAGLLALVRTRTPRHLTRSIGSTTASAASGGRYAAGPEDRASQGTLSKAKGKQSEPRRRTTLGPAQTHRLLTLNVRKGAARIYVRARSLQTSRDSRSAVEQLP